MGDLTFKETELLVKLAVLDIPKQITISNLALSIGLTSSSPTFVNVTKILNENKLIEIHSYFGNIKLVKVNEKKLRDFIDELPLTNLYFKYFKAYHLITW